MDFGVELDEVTSERVMTTKRTGGGKVKTNEQEEEIIYKIDVSANRYDILCIEGLARALNIFLEKQRPPNFVLTPAKDELTMYVNPNTAAIRPFCVCAVLRDVTFTEDSYKSFIDLQDKLHQNIARQRTLVAIGTHDLDTIQGPFTYDALPPSEINFTALNQTVSMTGPELMEHLSHDLKLRQYLYIIKDKPFYPVIRDANGIVLSLPPIINGDHSKIKLTTKNVFIECTATDLTKAKIVLNTMVTMFSEYCKAQFHIESVKTVAVDKSVHILPDMTPLKLSTTADFVNKSIGIEIQPEEIVKLLERMQLTAVINKETHKIDVTVPPTRSDIFHECDVMEDVAVAYGFNKIVKRIPATNTDGKQQPVNKLSELLRGEIAQMGFHEVVNFVLCSNDENFAYLGRPDDGTAVKVANPITFEFQLCRTSLIPGILKTLSNSKHHRLPMKVFELQDIVIKMADSDVGAGNVRHLSIAYCGQTSGLEVIHGALDRLFSLLRVGLDAKKENKKGYYITPVESPTFFPKRCADIILDGKRIGTMGIIHPDVLTRFELPFPVSLLELNVETLLHQK